MCTSQVSLGCLKNNNVTKQSNFYKVFHGKSYFLKKQFLDILILGQNIFWTKQFFTIRYGIDMAQHDLTKKYFFAAVIIFITVKILQNCPSGWYFELQAA